MQAVNQAAQNSLFEDASDRREVHSYARAPDNGLERSKTLPVKLASLDSLLIEDARGVQMAYLPA